MPEQNEDINLIIGKLTGILHRRRWWILITTCVIALASVPISYLLPNQYRSEAIIFISNRTVATQYVTPNDTANISEAIDALSHEILSRANLVQIINQFKLYPKLQNAGQDALATKMREDIEVSPLNKNPERRQMNAFMIAFTASNAATAQKVTDRLASLFIEQNQQREQRADQGTTDFLQKQLADAQTDLNNQQSALEAFKGRNAGELPEQQQGNLQTLSGFQIQLQATQSDLARARQQRTYLQTMLQQFATTSTGANGERASVSSTKIIQGELAQLKAQRDVLLSRYNQQYPDVVALNGQIAAKETQLKEAIGAEKNTPVHSSNIANNLIYSSDPAAIQLRSQYEANELEIRDKENQMKALSGQVAVYQQRLNGTPVLAQEGEALQRNYDISKQHYTDLMNKTAQSTLATDLSTQLRNQKFQVIDPASMPIKPSGPPRQKIVLGGLAGGLVAGLLLAFVIDLRDRSFHSEKEVRSFLPYSLILGIPPMHTLEEQRQLSRKSKLFWLVSAVMFVVILAVQLFIRAKG